MSFSTDPGEGPRRALFYSEEPEEQQRQGSLVSVVDLWVTDAAERRPPHPQSGERRAPVTGVAVSGRREEPKTLQVLESPREQADACWGAGGTRTPRRVMRSRGCFYIFPIRVRHAPSRPRGLQPLRYKHALLRPEDSEEDVLFLPIYFY